MLNGGRGQAVKALGCEPMIAGSNPVVRPFEGCDALCSQAGDNKPLLIQIVPRPLANESILACKVNCKGSLKTKCYLTCVFVNYEI